MTDGLGLDLGAGLAKLARATTDGQPGGFVTPLRTVQTAVAYRGVVAHIPPAGTGSGPGGWLPGEARDNGAADEVRYDGFPAMLGTGPAGQPMVQRRAPEEIAAEFLRLLLEDLGLAVTGPAVMSWSAAVPPGPTAGTAAELAAILSPPGWSSPRLLAAPLALLLYLRHSRPDIAPASRFIVCDLGASSATLTLCALAGYRIRIVDFLRVTGTSSWEADTRDYADVADRLPLLVEGLATALTGAEGHSGAADQAAPVRYWRELEQALADSDQRERLDAVVEQALTDPQRYGGTTALRIGDLPVTAAQLLQACTPLANRCATELIALLRRQRDPAWLRPGPAAGTRIVLAGGLSVLRPLRAALLSAAGLDPATTGGGVVDLDDTERLYGAAYGAALVAAGLTEPGDRYPYALRLPVHRQVRDRIVTSHVELAPAGSIDLDRADPVFARQQGEKIQVMIRPSAGATAAPIPVEVMPRGSDTAEPATFYPMPGPLPGLYHIGVRGHPNGAAVVLQGVDGGEQLTYPLLERPTQ